MLWWGWLGFNAGSVRSFVATPAVAAKVMGVTVIGGSAGGICTLLLCKVRCGYWDVGNATNGILAGLVSITAGSGTFEPEAAFIVGTVGGLVYYSSSNFLVKKRVRTAGSLAVFFVGGRGGEREFFRVVRLLFFWGGCVLWRSAEGRGWRRRAAAAAVCLFYRKFLSADPLLEMRVRGALFS